MDYFSKSNQLVEEQYVEFDTLEPFVLPAPKKNEELLEYVTAVKKDAPMENFQIGTINFEKRVLPEDATLVKNANKPIQFGVLVRKMTKSQAEAIKKYADKKKFKVPRRQNKDYDRNNPKSQEYLPQFMTTIGEWMILCLKSEMHGFSEPRDMSTEEVDDVETFRRKIYETQVKP